MKDHKNITVLIVLSLLLTWNLYLTYEIKQEDKSKVSENENKVVEKVSTQIDTDVVKVVKEVEEKVVSVITEKQGQVSGSGSGIIYKNEKGIIQIVTNHHVIDGGSKYIVRFMNGEEVEAKVVGSDVYTDLALLELEAKIDIKPFRFGDSDHTNVGEFVVAIGSPLGIEFENSKSFGILSGKNRVVGVDVNGDGQSDWDAIVLQTDAAINPGNSGGALVNMAGELIGINSMKISSNKVEGMGFAIPINEVAPIIKQIEETGKVNYPYLGISAVSIDQMNPFQKDYYNISAEMTEGVFIVEVADKSPAEKAGIKSGDVLLKFNNEKVNSFKDFRKKLYQHQTHDEVELELNRNNSNFKTKLTLE